MKRGYFWWDKQENEKSYILNCRLDTPTKEEIKGFYNDGYCLKDFNNRELILEEAIQVYYD